MDNRTTIEKITRVPEFSIEQTLQAIKNELLDPRLPLDAKQLLIAGILLGSDNNHPAPTAEQVFELTDMLYLLFGNGFWSAIALQIDKL